MKVLDVSALVRGFLLAVLVGVMGILILTAGLFFTKMPETVLPMVVRGVIFTAALVGSVFAAKSGGSKGLFYGLGVAVMGLVFLLLGELLIFHDEVTLGGLAGKAMLLAVGGALGGMVGVVLVKES